MTIDTTPPVEWKPGQVGDTPITAVRLNKMQTDSLKRVDDALVTSGVAAAGRPGTWDQHRSVYNLKIASLRRWRAALGRKDATVSVFGDSVGEGRYASSPQRANGWVGQLRSKLAVAYGDGGLGIEPGFTQAEEAGDPLWSLSGSWSTYGGMGVMGSGALLGSGSDRKATFSAAFTQATIFYAQGGVGGTFSAAIDGGTAVTQPTAGSGGYGKLALPAVASGNHTLVITAPSSGSLFLCAVEFRKPGVRVNRLAISSRATDVLGGTDATAGTWPYNDLQFGLMPADLTIIALGLNDAFSNANAQTVTQYKANLRVGVAAARANGSDVLLIVPNPPATSAITAEKWATYVAALYDLADELDLPLLDVTNRWGSQATAGAAPLSMYADELHPTTGGHGDYANAVFSAIRF